MPDVNLVGDRVTAGAVMPVPVKDTVCGLPLALSATEIEPFRLPVAVGVNVTEIAHVPEAATEVPQVLVWLKSPLAVMLVMESAAVPVLVRVMLCAALVVLSAWLPKVRLVGEKLTAGAIPVPLRETV